MRPPWFACLTSTAQESRRGGPRGPQPNGTLKNVATGLIVSPNGTGAQLRGTTAPSSWGGSVYKWTDFSHLPG